MKTWPPWPKTNEKALAGYVLPGLAQRFRLAQGREDVLAHPDGHTKLTELIYQALADKGLRYAREEYDPESEQQIVREPNLMLDGSGDGTCLDLALLFAGICLGNELLPIVVIVRGHAFVAVSLTHARREADSMARRKQDDPDDPEHPERQWVADGLLKEGETLKKLIQDGSWIAIECTGFVKSEMLSEPSESVPEAKGRENGLMSFKRACDAGWEQLFVSGRKFEFAIDPAVLQDLRKIPTYEPLSNGQAPAPFTPPVPTEPRPESYVERPELTEPLITRLLELRQNPGSLEISVIHGMGGIGKSSIAAWLAWHPLVSKRFPHGRLWATLGREKRQPLSILTDWIKGLGGPDSNPLSLEGARTELASLLQERAVLFIIDDVWPESDFEQFLFPAPRCQFLLTTRFPALVKQPNAQFFSVDEMSADQAKQLLTRNLHRPLAEDEEALADRLVEAVGGHPLALELAAARITEGVPWLNLIDQLSADIARLEALEEEQPYVSESAESRRKKLSVRASLLLSVRYLSEEYQRSFAWFGVLAEHAGITPMLAATLWSVDEIKAGKRLSALAGVNLLTQKNNTYRLHDLLHDLARNLLVGPKKPEREGDLPGLELSVEEASGHLLKAYKQKTKDGEWHTLKDDGYIFEHLVYHMAKAGKVDELRALLGKPWLEAQERRTGSFSAFASDLEAAITLLAKTRKKDFIDLFRWCYAYAILTSRATALHPDLLGALVYLGNASQAREYTKLIGDGGSRASAYLRMAKAAIAGDKGELAREFTNDARAALIATPNSERSIEFIAEFAMCANKLRDTGLLEYAATELASKAERDVESHWAVSSVCCAVRPLISLGQRERATQLVRSVVEKAAGEKDEIRKIASLLRVATSLRSLGVDDEAKKVDAQANDAFEAANRALGEAEEANITMAYSADLVEALIEAGDLDGSLIVADRWVVGPFSTWSYPGALAKIADAMLSAGRLEEAANLAAKATDLARERLVADKQIYDLFYEERKGVLVAIVKVLGRLGGTVSPLDFAADVGPPETRAVVLASISAVLAESGHVTEANRVVDECLKIARTASFSEVTEAAALVSLAQSMARLHETTDARQAIEQSQSLLGAETGSNRKLEQTRVGVAKAFALLGDAQEARGVLARSCAKSGTDEAILYSEPGRALRDELEIADALLSEGSSAEAEAMVTDIVNAARKLDHLVGKALALARAANIVGRLGHPDRALEYAREAVSFAQLYQGSSDTRESFDFLEAVGFAAGTVATHGSVEDALRIVQYADKAGQEDAAVRVQSQVVHFLWNAGNADRALDIARRLVVAEPSTRAMLAEALERAGARVQAQEEACQALTNIWPPHDG